MEVKYINSNKHGVYNSLIDSNYNATIIVDEFISGKMIVNLYDYKTVKNDLSTLPRKEDSKATFFIDQQFGMVNLTIESLKLWCPNSLCLAQICLHCADQACYPKLQVIQDNEFLIEEWNIYNGQVSEWSFKDYKIPFSYGHKIIHIIFEISEGDAEMLISLNDYNARPSLEFYDYKLSFNSSKEGVALTNDEIALNNCPQLEGLAAHENTEPCYYHIAIFGKKDSLFSIKVYPSSALAKQIPSNTLKSQISINTAEDRLFNIMNTENPATVSIEVTSGEALLYISLFDQNDIGLNSAFWPLPKESKMQYKSQNEYYEEILIEKNILFENCPSGLCIALLCGFCISETCEYQLEVKQELVEGQEELIISSSKMEILLFCVFIGLFGVWYWRYKKQSQESKDLENLTEALLVENQKSALVKESKGQKYKS